MLADLAICGRIVREPDGGRRPEAIQEIPVRISLEKKPAMLRKTVWAVAALTVLVGTLHIVARDRGRGGGRRAAVATPAKPPMANDAGEKKILERLDWMNKNQRRGNMNVPPADGRLLRMLTESIGAKHVVEIGRSAGYSGMWFCLALRATGGKLTTHEIDKNRAKLARENFKIGGVEKFVNLVEGDAHKEVAKINEPIDIIFLDADKEGHIDYLKKLVPKLRPGGLILAHNARSHGSSMKDHFDAVTTDAKFDTIFLHMQGSGIRVTLKKRPAKAGKQARARLEQSRANGPQATTFGRRFHVHHRRHHRRPGHLRDAHDRSVGHGRADRHNGDPASVGARHPRQRGTMMRRIWFQQQECRFS